ncbi:MAG: ABC transporter substrate-binding protein [Bdellovibrionaceae bacterium]|nr:ABC transporter substrate-binding protein [Pseudobdellovibrionaceae bacterium]
MKLTLNWKAEPQFGGFYAAKLNNEFKKRNLEVEIIEGGSGTPTVQMLAAGKTDFAIVSSEEILIARDRGADVKAVFAVYQTNPQAIMTHAEKNYASLKDVFNNEGTLSMQSGLSYAQFLLKKYPNPKVKIVPDSGGITLFKTKSDHSQQCFFTSEPLLAESAGLKVKTFLVSEEGFNPYTTVVAVSEATLKKSPNMVKTFSEAVRAGWQAYLKDPEPTNKFMSGLNKAMDSATFTRSAAAQKNLIETEENKSNGLGTMTAKRWFQLTTQMKDLGLIKKTQKASDLYQNY